MLPSPSTGIHPGANLSSLNEEEAKIVVNFSREWYVTNCGRIHIANSSYSYALIKPSRNYQEMFNLDRELILVFSSYDEFQPRTLDAIDRVFSQY